MLYLDHTTDPQPVRIPREEGSAGGTLFLTLRSTVDQSTVTLTPTVTGDGHHYFHLTAALPQGMTEGEYEYTLLADGETVASGLAIVGDYSTERTTYNNDITYEQYTTE